MEYEIIQPPFTLDFHAMQRQEALAYFKWFSAQIPVRTMILERAVRSTPTYEPWNADFSPLSLGLLGTWLYSQTETRLRTREEKEEIYQRGPRWFRSVEIEDWELTNRTFSLAMDVGMYVSQIFMKKFPSLKLELITEPKNSVDFQQPVLSGFKGGIYYNPVRLIVTLAYAFADRSWGPQQLVELYNIWAGLVR